MHNPLTLLLKVVDMRQDPHTDGITVNAANAFHLLNDDFDVVAKVNPTFKHMAPTLAAAPVLLQSLKTIIKGIELNTIIVGDRENYLSRLKSVVAKAEV